MLIIGTFEHSVEVEEALAVIEKSGVPRKAIMTVVMDKGDPDPEITATRYPHKKTLAFEIGMAAATAFSVVGISYGFVSRWGPIICDIVSAAIGFMLGACVTRLAQSPYFRRGRSGKGPLPELVVMIRCSEASFHELRLILRRYRALSVGRIDETG